MLMLLWTSPDSINTYFRDNPEPCAKLSQQLNRRAQATHEQVPPDALAPVMKQLVDAFISDRTRPEAMAVGIKTVRELAARSPLLMTRDLLQV